jgi:hypothetical protein
VWRQAEKPLFDVQHLTYKLRGNNVPMPSALVKHLLRVFIPEIIQVRRCFEMPVLYCIALYRTVVLRSGAVIWIAVGGRGSCLSAAAGWANCLCVRCWYGQQLGG